LKRRNELQRTQAEAQLKLMRIKHQQEVEALMDLEKQSSSKINELEIKTSPVQAVSQVESSSSVQKDMEKFVAERKEAEVKKKE
jgi:hypothetical protein